MGNIEAEIVDLYERYVEGIYCFCLFRLYDRDLAEEATSEVFLKFIEKYPSLQKNGLKKKAESHIRNWLYGTARNAITRQIRQAKRQKETTHQIGYTKEPFIAESDTPNRNVEFDEIYKAIGKLNTRDQEILVRRYMKGLPTSDIAEWMGIAHGTVRVRLSRAIRTLRKLLGKKHV